MRFDCAFFRNRKVYSDLEDFVDEDNRLAAFAFVAHKFLDMFHSCKLLMKINV